MSRFGYNPATGTGTAPFPRTKEEWTIKGMEKGMDQAAATKAAEHRIAQDVFGQDYTTDAKGEPIERGKGSAAQQTAQHLQALDMSREAERARAMRLGWGPHLEGAFDPKMQAEVDRRVAEALANRKPRRKGAAKRKAPAPETVAG